MRQSGKITSIHTQKAHPERVSIFVDGEFELTMNRELAFRLGLRTGMQVTEEDIETWIMEEKRMTACELAIKYLTTRQRSRQEVLNYLGRKEFSREISEQAVKYLESLGYLDDERFAASYVENRLESKPRGRRMIRLELQRKGVCEDAIEHALSAYEDETEAARRLLSKKRSFKRVDDPASNRETELKIGRFLAGKGFSSSTIQSIIKEWRQS